MNVCKFSTGADEEFPIERDIFESKTYKQYPYYQISGSSVTSSKNGNIHFAVCPACDNPIQIMGLYKTNKPFGKHYPKTVPDLAEYNQEAYEYCPLASSKKRK